MTIGDAGDDFAEQVLRTSMDLAKDILRYIDGLDMPHKSWADKYEIAREDASRVAEASFGEAEDELSEPQATWLWAPNEREADELCANLERKGYEFTRAKARKSDGVVKVRVAHNNGCVPIAEGGEFNPVDFDDPETLAVLDAYSYESCKEYLGVLADATALKKALVDSSENIDYVPRSPENCVFRFTTVPWDRDGNVLLDYLDRAGIANESWICEIPASEAGLAGPDEVRGIAVEFNARNAPHVQAAVDALLRSGIRGLDQSRFPQFAKAMREAQTRASSLYGQEGLGYESLSVTDERTAEAVRSALVEEGVACAAINRAEAGNWEIVVDRADAIASQWRIKQLAREYEAPARQAKKDAEALSQSARRREKPDNVAARRRSSKYAKKSKDTPSRDELAAREGAERVNRARKRGMAIDTPSLTHKKPSR